MNLTETYLTILGEEAVEVALAMTIRTSKALRFGLTEAYQGQNQNNAERVAQEMADLTGIYEMLVEAGALPPIDRDLVEAKKEKVRKYTAYSVARGLVSGSPFPPAPPSDADLDFAAWEEQHKRAFWGMTPKELAASGMTSKEPVYDEADELEKQFVEECPGAIVVKSGELDEPKGS